MSERADKIARGIKAFVENPITNLVKGLSLLLIGISEVSHNFQEDVSHGQWRVGHGLIIIGVFGILSVLPQFLEGMAASERYLELRKAKKEAKTEENKP